MKTCNILTLVAAAAAAMLLASCQSLEQNIETPEETGVTRDADGHLLIPFSAETGAAQTKAEMLGGSTANIVYSEGDKMIVFSTSMSTSCPVLPSIMNLVGGVGTKKGTFKGDIVLRSGKTEADFNTWVTKYPGNLKAVIIPAAGIEAGLFTWDKPAYACLATRIRTGEEITEEKLSAVEASEDFLFSLGFTDFRVRRTGNTAKIQIKDDQFDRLIAMKDKISEEFIKYYDAVTLDLEGR